MTNGQRIQFMYIVGLAYLIKRPEFLHGFDGVDDLIHADEGLSDQQVEAVLKANIDGLAAELERDRPKSADDEQKFDRPLHIEICRRQFGGDAWDRYHDEYLVEVAERAIEQAHAHAINEDDRRDAERIATRERNLEILGKLHGLHARYYSMYSDEVIANAAATVLDAQEDEARKENARRDRARGPFDFLQLLFGPTQFSPAFRSHTLRLS